MSSISASTNDTRGLTSTNRRQGKRARVTRACDRCKKRKIKCDGTHPCSFCDRAKTPCTFEVAYTRGRPPTIPSIIDHRPSGYHAQVDSSDGDTRLIVPPLPTRDVRRPLTSPEDSEAELQGQYIGPSSGVSFLHRVQKRLDQAISFSQPNSIFTFGDAPLRSLEGDASFCMILPATDAKRLVDRYFDFAMPTYRFLHRPTINLWVDEFYETHGLMHDPKNAAAKQALLFLTFAHGLVYMPDDERPAPFELSARYFQAAERRLADEKGAVRLTSIQARFLQCCYLLTQSRINHCWSSFGTVARLAISMGLNRDLRPDAMSAATQIEVEYGRRTFWCAYVLDIYLSVALGRARAFHDEDIDARLPICHDASSAANPDVNGSDFESSVMLAPIAHIKLARIISKVLRDLYSIKPVSSDLRAVLVERISKEMSDWRVELSAFLDAPYLRSPHEPLIFQRQRNVLNLTYWHAIILVHRPSILNSLGPLASQDPIMRAHDTHTEESVQQCLNAAMNTVKTIDDITHNRQMFRVFWITTYFAFAASIVLYICVIQKHDLSTETFRKYLAAATKCQAQISSISEKGSLSERYCLLLDELRTEALRRTEGSRNLSGDVADSQNSTSGLSALNVQPSVEGGYPMVEHNSALMDATQNDFNNFLTQGFPDLHEWDQFTSMVSSGLGNLDAFLSDDHFKL